jgi:hypothetical protein
MIDDSVEKIYYKCSKCGEIREFLPGFYLEREVTKADNPVLVAAVLMGKIPSEVRSCDRCNALSYSEYMPSVGDD